MVFISFPHKNRKTKQLRKHGPCGDCHVTCRSDSGLNSSPGLNEEGTRPSNSASSSTTCVQNPSRRNAIQYLWFIYEGTEVENKLINLLEKWNYPSSATCNSYSLYGREGHTHRKKKETSGRKKEIDLLKTPTHSSNKKHTQILWPVHEIPSIEDIYAGTSTEQKPAPWPFISGAQEEESEGVGTKLAETFFLGPDPGPPWPFLDAFLKAHPIPVKTQADVKRSEAVMKLIKVLSEWSLHVTLVFVFWVV